MGATMSATPGRLATITRSLSLLFALCGTVVVAPSVAAQNGQVVSGVAGSAADMSFLIGTWNVTETIYPGEEREYVEVSVRSCAWSVADTYTFCRNVASGRGRQRETWFFVDQPGGTPNIEMLGVYSNGTGKFVYRGQFLPDGSGIDLRNHEIGDTAVVAGTYQRLRFRGPDEFVWQIGITNPGTDSEGVIGIETAVRVSTQPLLH
jgi:hypothetical protein